MATTLERNNLNTARVRDWMTASVPIITAQTTIATALRLLREHRLPALPVSTENGLLGLVDEKALLRYTPSEATTLDIYEMRDVLDRLTVSRAAVPPRAVVGPDTTLDEAAALIVRTGTDVIAVLDAGKFVGLLTWPSLLAAAVGAPRIS